MKNVIASIAITFVSFFGVQSAHAMITSQLDLGSTGSNVTELQTYLTANASLYPAGLITGFFGPLTQGGVQKFQVQQGIVSSGSPQTTGYGRVGPATLASLNSLNGNGAVLQNNANEAPVMGTVNVISSNSSATFTWTTNESSRGQVFYDTAPLSMAEATGPQQEPFVSGAFVSENSASFNHSITLVNLHANTTYHFLVRSTDLQGNMSMILPATFTTQN